MKEKRQAAIRELLQNRDIQTQEDLVQALKNMGFQVTQATVSRDVKEMHLIKMPGAQGGYRYEEPVTDKTGQNEKLIRLLKDCVIHTEAAGQIVVVKTISGSASTAAEALDTLEMPEIVGSIAGDNTIFLVARDHAGASAAAERILKLIS